jgi:phage major head subunit gpT-like protein
MIINAANMAILNQSFNAAFKGAFDVAAPMSGRIAMTVPSTTSEEKYGWLGMSTTFREWLGERQYQALKTHSYSIKNKRFENTVEVDRDSIEDDQYGVFSPLMSQLGQDSALHPDELVFGLLQQGFNTACYDGQYFFDTDHPVGLPGKVASVSNFQGGSGSAWYLLDMRKIIKPIILQKRRPYNFVAKDKLDDEDVFKKNTFVYGADGRSNVGFGMWQFAYGSKQPLDKTAYAAARSEMGSFKADNGKPLNVMGNLLLVPPNLEMAALEVIKQQRGANGADNVYANTAEVLVCPWLS